jgi:ubiquinone/menaquinone biosynthesis C-methylase UbiE
VNERNWHHWKKDAQSEFNRWAATYDQSILNRLLFRRCYLKFIELILKFFPVPDRSLRLLDIGCGTGTFVAMLGQTNLPVHPMGLDMAERMCRLAHEKAAQVNLADRVHFITGDSEHLPFPNNSFDVVTCSNSFHHYPHQNTVLGEIRRILRPGGRVMVLDGFRDNVIGWLIFDVVVAHAEKSVHHCSAREMWESLRDQGYADIYQEKFGFWVPVLASVGTKP